MATTSGLSGSFWPTAAQELLLRAVLLEGQAAEEAWRALRPGFDAQRFESGSLGLLALLYEQRGASEPSLARLKGVRRYLWYGNHVGLQGLEAALRELSEQSVDTIVLGDAALIERYYGRLGVRQLVQPALLVRTKAAAAAAAALERAGWRRSAERSGRHQGFEREQPGSDAVCTLHWRLPRELEPLDGAPSLDGVWDAAQPLSLRGVPAASLSAADELLATCVTGVRSRSRPSFQWIVDAATILRTSGDRLDWDRLVAEAARRRCALRLHDGLSYLVRALDAAVPVAVLHTLEVAPSSGRERFAHRLAGRGGRLAGNLPSTLAAHVVASQHRSVWSAAVGLPGFLRAEWGLDHLAQLPGATARRLVATAAASRRRDHASS